MNTLKKSNKFVKAIMTVLLVMLLFGMVIAVVVINMMKNSAPYEAAVKFIESNNEIEKYVGKVTGYGWLISGQSSEMKYEGSAFYNITVKGEKDDIDVTIRLEKDSLGWNVQDYYLH